MMNEYQKTLDMVNSIQRTENGAVGYSTSGNPLVDLNFRIPSNHNNVKGEDVHSFVSALQDDMVTAAKWLFYLRDVREGLGERDSFVTLFLAFSAYNIDAALKLIPLIPEFGRWKDLIDILSYTGEGNYLAESICTLISEQIKEDLINMKEEKKISLLAKWLPSINASKKARRTALFIARKMELCSMEYRKMLSALRSYTDVTEIKTCSDRWNEIDYNKVSSNANARYVKAFMKHDPERRKAYLDALNSPEKTGAVMHASNLYPHEVYAKYNNGRPYNLRHYTAEFDQGIEALWANLKDIPTTGNTMVVCDGSGSMESYIKGTNNIMAIDVSRSLSIFFSERNTGEYKDKVVEFSASPRYIDLSDCHSLVEKYNKMNKFDDCSNTNLQLVFDLLLETAITNNIPQSEVPQRILIVSDMEFDGACEYAGYRTSHTEIMDKYKSLFETIKQRWTDAGYTMPNIVFWNVNSRTQTIPVTSNEAGVILVSGFSVNNVKMILSGETDPWTALKSVLDSERYQVIGNALES